MTEKRSRKFTIAAALGLGAITVFAVAQNADKNTAGPTRNDYRLRVVEPAEGAAISGASIRIAVDTEIPAEAGEERRDVNSMPRPEVDVYVDGSLKGTMRDAQNVLTVDGLPPGTHDAVLVAKNGANEIIDRTVLHFSTVEAQAAGTAPGRGTTTAEPPVAIVDSAGVTLKEAPPAPSHDAQTAAATTDTTPRSSPEAASRLPKTATSDPALAAGGLALLVAGVALRRFARENS